MSSATLRNLGRESAADYIQNFPTAYNSGAQPFLLEGPQRQTDLCLLTAQYLLCKGLTALREKKEKVYLIRSLI
jgi:hypothetical protein